MATTGLLQRRRGRIQRDHPTPRTERAGQLKGKITCAAAEIQPELPSPGMHPSQQLSFPDSMQAEAQPVVQTVVPRGHLIKQLLNSSGIAWLHRGMPFKAITITVASPTAAEHTMQPASISENSC